METGRNHGSRRGGRNTRARVKIASRIPSAPLFLLKIRDYTQSVASHATDESICGKEGGAFVAMGQALSRGGRKRKPDKISYISHSSPGKKSIKVTRTELGIQTAVLILRVDHVERAFLTPLIPPSPSHFFLSSRTAPHPSASRSRKENEQKYGNFFLSSIFRRTKDVKPSAGKYRYAFHTC